MPTTLRSPHALGLLDAWQHGETNAALLLADFLEERGNDDDLPLAGLRWLGEAGKAPFEDTSLRLFPDADSWMDDVEELPQNSGRVWTWLWGEDAWGLPYDVVRGFAAPFRPWEWGDEIRYNLNVALVERYGDPRGIVLSRTLRIVEVTTFSLAVIVAALGHEVRIGLREGAPPAPPRNTEHD